MRTQVPDKCVRCAAPIRPTYALIADYPGTTQHAGRGLCGPCRKKCVEDDTLLDYPRLKRSHAEVLEDLATLRESGINTRPEIEKRMNMKWSAIYQAVFREGRQDLLIGLPAQRHRKALTAEDLKIH